MDSTGGAVQLRRLGAQAGVRRRFTPHQLRHAHAVELAREGLALNIIQCQLGYPKPRMTTVYPAYAENPGVMYCSVHSQ